MTPSDFWWGVVINLVSALFVGLWTKMGPLAKRSARWMIARAARRLTPDVRAERQEEWLAEVEASPWAVAFRFAFGIWVRPRAMREGIDGEWIVLTIGDSETETTITYSAPRTSLFRFRQLLEAITNLEDLTGQMPGPWRLETNDKLLRIAFHTRRALGRRSNFRLR